MNILKEIAKIDKCIESILDVLSVEPPLQSRTVQKILNDPKAKSDFLLQLGEFMNGNAGEIVIEFEGETHKFTPIT